MNIFTNQYPEPGHPVFKKRVATATVAGTSTLLSGLFLAFTTISIDQTSSLMARQVAIVVAIAIAVSIWFDSSRGWRNLFRADLLCLTALYFLTLVEFLYPQDKFDQLLSPEQTAQALYVLLIGFAGLGIGRHFNFMKPAPQGWLDFNHIPNKVLFRLFLVSALLAYFYMLLSVDFNPLTMIDALLGPRFAVPWGRERLGDWRSFLTELKLFAYVIPPLTGIIWNRRQSFRAWQIFLVITIFAFTLFEGFAGGTRNVFSSYIATFLGGYLLSLRRPNLFNVGIPTAVMGYAMVFATRHMLGFRDMGITRYLATGAYATEKVQGTLAVDYNLNSIGLLVDTFPKNHDFLGLEVLFVFATKPIPRVLWPDKPENLSVSIEQVTGAQGWTVASTYIGESYMVGGILAVIIISLALGMLASWWSRTAAVHTTGYGTVVNALGFFTAGITMRSLSVLTTSILPVLALIFIVKLFPSLLGIKRLPYQYPPQ
ncbi:MAG: O-antigen polymerase [Aulosira sp. ZfuVER01]|nr:O-antigen polymerase [Aulosira sp. ZfuVER01]MDZ7997758.1 O-antigen polymerase [Aulosira sp. DedVER01a]MDZ8052253.1 O-antigen polymerase [Aulosira sp. ZfuCHP01]